MFGWLFQKPRYYQYPDTFGFKQSTVDDALHEAIAARVDSGDIVVLVCHFPATFERFQTMLDRWRIEYSIPTEKISSRWLVANASEQGTLILTLSQMLEEEQSGVDAERLKRQLSILVAEKHPEVHWDQQIEAFARTTPFVSKLGYYLAFEQPLIDYCFGQHERQLLKHWTSIDDIVFSSTLASRRVSSKIKSNFSRLEEPRDAESIEQWLKQNGFTVETGSKKPRRQSDHM